MGTCRPLWSSGLGGGAGDGGGNGMVAGSTRCMLGEATDMALQHSTTAPSKKAQIEIHKAVHSKVFTTNAGTTLYSDSDSECADPWG